MALETRIYKTWYYKMRFRLSMVSDIGRHDASPLVIVYPEAVIYGPVTVEDIPYLVEEHLYKGRIASNLVASPHKLSGTNCLVVCPERVLYQQKNELSLNELE